MQDTMLKFRALFKAQSALARIELRARARQAVYVALAAAFGFAGLAMFNVGAFLALESWMGRPGSAVLLGVIDCVLAALAARWAVGATRGSAREPTRELRDLALGALAADADRLKRQYVAFQTDLARLQAAVSSVSSGAASLLPALSSIVSLLTRALELRKRNKKEAKEIEESKKKRLPKQRDAGA